MKKGEDERNGGEEGRARKGWEKERKRKLRKRMKRI